MNIWQVLAIIALGLIDGMIVAWDLMRPAKHNWVRVLIMAVMVWITYNIWVIREWDVFWAILIYVFSRYVGVELLEPLLCLLCGTFDRWWEKVWGK